jgi:insertion element IS1 protein InsB
MFITSIVHTCPQCGSTNLVKNGHTTYGAQRCLCHDCGKTKVVNPVRKVRSLQEVQQVYRAFRERCSLRGIARIFNLSLETLLVLVARLVEQLPPLRQSVVEGHREDVIELDELGSFVGKKTEKRWLWIALCRRTRQVIAFFLGDRSEQSCRRLFRRIPYSYRRCCTLSDFWKTYQKVFATGKHQFVGKETGETAHVERWNCTLRQRISRYVRKSLAFSKKDKFHLLTTKLFIWFYNIEHAKAINIG